MGGGRGLVRREIGQSPGQAGNGARQIAHAAAGDVLFVHVVLFEQGEPLQFGIGFGQGQDGRVARCDGLDLGIGKFLAADVLGPAGGVVAGDDLADEPGLGLQCLPHIGVERSFRDVAINRHFLVLVALAEDSALALFDLGRLPRGVEVMQCDQAFLDIGAGAHLLRAADQHAHRTLPAPSRRGPVSWRRIRHRRWRRSARPECRQRLVS